MYEDVCDRNEVVIRGASVLRWRELLKDTKYQTRNDTLVNLYRDRVDRRVWREYAWDVLRLIPNNEVVDRVSL